jgi:hypothetical protein
MRAAVSSEPLDAVYRNAAASTSHSDAPAAAQYALDVPQPLPDPYLDNLGDALSALASGDRARADNAIAGLAVLLPDPPDKVSINPKLTASVFQRDGYLCRYCGRRTVPPAILRAASLVWPQYLPYNPNWRADATHPIFATLSASVDHVEPRAHGGSSVDQDNLVTACWPHNSQKGELTLEHLGWVLLPPRSTDWDGLVGVYPSIWQVAAALATPAQKAYHLRWLRALYTYGGGVDA